MWVRNYPGNQLLQKVEEKFFLENLNFLLVIFNVKLFNKYKIILKMLSHTQI